MFRFKDPLENDEERLFYAEAMPRLFLQFQGLYELIGLHAGWSKKTVSLTSQAPGLGFTEDSFSTDRVVVVGWFGMI